MSRNVLVVDDDDTARRLMVHCLGEYGIEADVARDGAEAFHRIRMGDYSVVLLDLMMPHMSGIDLLDSLQATFAPAARVPPRIIVVTSAAREEIPDADIERRLPGSVVSVLRKPVDLAAVVDTIRRVAAG